MNLEDLKNIEEVIVLATGDEKIPSIKSLVSHKFIDHLIIVDNIAEALVSNIQEYKQSND